MRKLFLLSLGCSKNTVDSERLMAQAAASGLLFTEEPDEADTIVVNTCGFIRDAKEESIAETLAAIDKKVNGSVQKVFVMGCLPELHRKELQEELPEVDGFFGTRELPQVLTAIGARYRRELFDTRILLTPPHYAYLKIAEGCDRHCSFCSIPKIRGGYASRAPEQLLHEALLLQHSGVTELNLVAQDITMYGYDLEGRSLLNDLLLRLSDMAFRRIRLLYAYPVNFPLAVIETMRNRRNICNYLDLPLQHVNDRILRSMNRGIDRTGTIRLLESIRDRNPDIRLRTTMIAGYPGETNEEFEELLRFIEETRFERLGCFPYCHEEHAPAYRLHDDVDSEVKQDRVAKIMASQEEISQKKNRSFEGREIDVLVDQVKNRMVFGRTEYDAPEVDNECILENESFNLHPGMFCRARITGSTPYDLEGEVTGTE